MSSKWPAFSRRSRPPALAPRDRHLVAVEVKYRSQAPELLPLTLRQARRIYRAACALRPKPLINEEVEVQLCLVLGNLESPQIQVFAEFYAPWD